MDRSRFERLIAAGWCRHRVLAGTAGLAVAAGLPGHPCRVVGARRAAATAPPRSGEYPFTLRDASRGPLPGGVVPCTRLPPAPLAEDGLGGMDPAPVVVSWEVAPDAAFSAIG